MVAGDGAVRYVHGVGAGLRVQRVAQGAQKRRITVRRKLARAARGGVVDLKERLDQAHQFPLAMHHRPELRHRLDQRQVAQIHAAHRRHGGQGKQLFVPQVGALQIHHPLILRERARQLAKTHLHRVHQRRSVLDEAVGETAGTGSGIDAYAAFQRDTEIADGTFQLVAPLAHVAVIQAVHGHGLVGGHQLPACGHRLRAAVDRAAHQIGQGGFAAVKEALFQQAVHGGALLHHTPSAFSSGSQARTRSR